jgi:poly-gamma-glutamate capsule biosynthesis protein CapA/YwtB (metallophosphatase superfamily)
MLGRGVAEAMRSGSPSSLFAGEIIEVVREADLFILNLECCISERGERWPDPGKPFFFRAPPQAVDLLGELGVDCVTLANNHALDYGPVALRDTLEHLTQAGIAAVGAGVNLDEARRPVVLERGGLRLRVVGFTDHPPDFAAGPESPGVAYVPLGGGLPQWLVDSVRESPDPVLVTPHWGPNMTAEPVPRVRSAARQLVDSGVTLIAGHSAHIFHGVVGRILYDLGDFIDDYAVDPALRNDLGLLFLVELESAGPVRVEAVPIALDFCHTRLARGEENAWIEKRFVSACAQMGTDVDIVEGRLVIESVTD